jgi:hypothetical protein
LGNALTSPKKKKSSEPPGPPSVSTNELMQRFNVELITEEEEDVPFSVFFKPALHTLCDSINKEEFDKLIKSLLADVNVVCAIAESHQTSKSRAKAAQSYFVSGLQLLYCSHFGEFFLACQ